MIKQYTSVIHCAFDVHVVTIRQYKISRLERHYLTLDDTKLYRSSILFMYICLTSLAYVIKNHNESNWFTCM